MDFDIKVVEKMLDIEIKMLQCFLFLLDKDKISKDVYNNELDKLKIYIKKENMLISKLPNDIETLNYIMCLVHNNSHNFFDDDIVSIFVLNRFDNIVKDLIELSVGESYDDSTDFYFDGVNDSETRIKVRDTLNVDFILSIDDNLDLQILNAYCYKNISDYLVASDLDFSLLIDFYTSLFNKFGFSNDDIEEIKQEEIFNSINDILTDIFVLAELDSNVSFYYVSKFAYLLSNIDDQGLLEFKEIYDESTSGFSDEIFDILGGIIDFSLSSRKISPSLPQGSKQTSPVKQETVSNLITLIKLEETLFDLFEGISVVNQNDYEIIERLASMLRLENDYVSNIDVDKSEADSVYSMITSDLSLFISDSQKRNLISERLINLIPFFRRLDKSPTQSDVSFDYINQNHIISSFSRYLRLLSSTDSRHKEILSFSKELLFIYPSLTADFCAVGGNYLMFTELSDSTVSKLIGINEFEYSYDKSEQLSEVAKCIILELLSQRFPSDWAYNQFKLEELKDIIDDSNQECFEELLEIVKSYSNSPLRSIILNYMLKQRTQKKMRKRKD